MAEETKRRNIKFNNRSELRQFYAALLESGTVDGIVLPVKNRSGRTVQALVTETGKLETEETFSEVIPVQGGRIAKNLTFTDSGKKIAILCKPCEVKAIVELTKFLQVKKERLFVIGTDCAGTYEITDTESSGFRKACTICDMPAVTLDLADAVLGFFGMQDETFILSVPNDSPIAALLKDMEEHKEDDLAYRQEEIEKISASRSEEKNKVLEQFGTEIDSLEKLQEKLSKCIRCHNCMVACPICYCRECVFRSPTFEHSSESIMNWAERKGGMRMPENTLLFHLTRLNHMASSCIACGLCSSACPNDIDVATLFIHGGEKVQNMLSYKAGRSYDEQPPVTTFREDELTEETGAR